MIIHMRLTEKGFGIGSGEKDFIKYENKKSEYIQLMEYYKNTKVSPIKKPRDFFQNWVRMKNNIVSKNYLADKILISIH